MVKETEKHLGLRLSEQLLTELRQLAKEDARSINSEVIWALRRFVEQRKQEKEVKQESVSKT